MMKTRHANRRPGTPLAAILLMVIVFAGAFVGAFAGAGDTLRIESAWAAEAPAIDGQLKDWASPLVSLGSAPLSIGVRNDGAFLYVALASSEQNTRMLLGAAGFTLWWDPAGKDKKAWGITVPPAMAGQRDMRGRGQSGMPPDQGDPQQRPDTPPQGRGEPPAGQSGPPAQGQDGQRPPLPPRPAMEPIGHIEVIGPGKDDRRRLEMTYAKTIGLDVAAGIGEGVLVYEFRVPLPASEGQPYAVRSAPGGSIGLGIETGKIPRPAGRGEGGEGGRGGTGGGGGRTGGGMGGGGMTGGSRGGMGGGPPGGARGGMSEPKPVKAWVVVHLASPPA